MKSTNQRYPSMIPNDNRDSNNAILFIIVLIAMILFFVSCSKAPKDSSRCWQCTKTESKYSPTTGNITSSDVDEICNQTQAQIKAHEDSNTYSKNYGLDVSVTVKTTCQ